MSQRTTIYLLHKTLTIQNPHVVHILPSVRRAHGPRRDKLLFVYAADISSRVKIEELCVREQSEFGVDIEPQIVWLCCLLEGRGQGVQLIEILREVGRTTPVEFGHGAAVLASIALDAGSTLGLPAAIGGAVESSASGACPGQRRAVAARASRSIRGSVV